MKSRVVLITVLLAAFGSTAQADTFSVGGKHSAGQPTIIRGAPLRCEVERPLIINVRQALRHPDRDFQKCEVQFRRKHNHHAYSITNIVIIAGRHDRRYIKAPINEFDARSIHE